MLDDCLYWQQSNNLHVYSKPEILNEVAALEIFSDGRVYYKIRWVQKSNKNQVNAKKVTQIRWLQKSYTHQVNAKKVTQIRLVQKK